MKKKIQNKATKITISLLLILLILSISWFIVTHNVYYGFRNSEDHLNSRGWLADRICPSYVYQQNDYIIQIYYPEYLSLTGNLVISTKDDRYSLFIWPGILEKTSYGVSLHDENSNTGYMMDIKREVSIDSLKAEDPLNQERLDSNADIVTELLNFVDKKWGEIL